ncbi:polyphosphate:AMP phosphotransferase [Bordetella avium]|uniref:Polyphosphate kinase-2-related domain-containing protein n=1 Tax=Bordetella avium (strain 197N) TaxID=360910 RepID=Q2L0U3_BORA1|nr:polyphosphate:AMP phosphotransferase [Bordetella avium]AZY51223.1 polyphosphate:AMP phosphotransferase [Bordetella avium]RIQ14920.1 polyphosphate:AMP phosphotransferase [Bordetella avium]RIQ18587.1 polyphosphate:AMP phosphotransferase [Bordetella avium]RIQ35377.1 polyphosphate:AMP phosphotransferase [Bordetella avium]RIQ41385.1 polyphosphate:AMP phosphotransferase [Bordetella avium]
MFIEAQSDPVYPKEDYKAREHQLRTALLKAQYERLNRADRSLLIVVAGIDGAGKGQTINQLNDWMDPRHIHTAAFGEPDEIEAQFPPLWRYWNAIPAKGQTGIVFGSWYSQLLRECYRKKTRPDRIEGIGAQIRRFEAMLTAEGVQIVKLWYHLSAKAQVERIERLTSSPETSWQVSPDDYRVAKRYDRLCDAANIALALTDQDHAPWVVIPSADDNMRVIRTAETVLATMKRRAIPIVARAAMDRPRLGPVPDRLGDLDYDAHEDKHDYERELGLLQGRLAQAVRSEKFQKRSLILAFEGQDAAGKGGAIQRIVQALDARRYDITPVAAPAPYEQARPYLWRFWRQVPRRSRIAIFDRTWYGRVLVERVEKLTPPGLWRRAYGEINDFERQLVENGAIVLKFWLAITQDVQLERFKERENTPFKRYKITPEDWRNREKWQDYAQATNEMLARTDLPHAPWYPIPANDKRYARLQVLRHIVDALEKDDAEAIGLARRRSL